MPRMLLLALLVFSQQVIAEEFTCRSGNEVRIISVEYEHKGWSVPCRVKYEKPAEDLVEYPWRANATPGYCEDRAAFLASKLENWGWVCTRTDATPGND
ncbi:MAG: hypothetical protein O3B72_08505 [Proteobacteria bacterium]|nr:hypothetical protein [Pseudomonadota bacterium]